MKEEILNLEKRNFPNDKNKGFLIDEGVADYMRNHIDEQTGVIHILKTHRAYFVDVWAGIKLFELRKDDRNYTKGDHILLRLVSEENPNDPPAGLTCYVFATITSILRDVPQFGLQPGYAILGLSPVTLNISLSL